MRTRITSVFLVLLGACVPEGPSPDTCVPSEEVCDGLDNDCDGVADEGVGTRVWRDDDGDGYGDPRVPLLICTPPEGYVGNPADCDDRRSSVSPVAPETCDGLDNDCNGLVDDGAADGATSYADADGDGFGDASTEMASCPGVEGRVANGDDCDDGDATVRGPVPRFVDGDLDGYGAGDPVDACPSDPALADDDGDCADDDPSRNPGAPEVTADGVDQDCDGFEACYRDVDVDGFGTSTLTSSTDLTCTTSPAAPVSGDCDDQTPTVHPGRTEVCGNATDDDCDPNTPDVVDLDGDGQGCDLDCDDTTAPSATVRHTDIAAAAGVAVLQGMPPYPCGNEILAGGAAVADFDGDGDPDVYLARIYLPDVLFQNDGDGTYTDVTAAWGLGDAGSGAGAVFFDADGDGDLDLYVTKTGLDANRLYMNQGTGFTEEGLARGVAHAPPTGICQQSYSVSVADVDGDGDLDLHTTGWEALIGVSSNRDQLFLNDGTGVFAETPVLDLVGRASYTSSFADFDDDGDLDVAVSADWGRSMLWRNDGPLLYTEVTSSAGVGSDENGMGSAVGDVDGDGLLDWFVTSIYDTTLPCPSGWGCTGNRLYLGNGDLTFVDATDNGVRDGAWSWGTAFFDFDNDGDLDIGAENGFPNPMFRRDFTRLWENKGPAGFTETACETGLASPGQGRSLVPFDSDLDGDLDLLVVHAEETVRLYETSGVDPNGWLSVALSQPGRPNTHAIGATVWLTPRPGDAEVRRDIHLNSQFGSTSPAVAHFGLGAYTGPLDELRVVWPDGAEQVFTGYGSGQRITLVRGVP
ncbi:MAG: FG-GAP-like repeat-containing protein [Myxococcota bacterium]